MLLPDKTVSRRHARLEVGEDGAVTLEDLSSTNGTQVGGDVLAPHVARALQAGDRVRFGSVVTVLHLPGVAGEAAPILPAAGMEKADPIPADTSATLSTGAPEGPSEGRGNRQTLFSEPLPSEGRDRPGTNVSGPGLGLPLPPAGAGASPTHARARLVETREEDGRTFPLVPGVTTFGRRADNSVVLPGDPYVSGSHAQVIADGDVFRLTDVGSTNGTLLNGRRLAVNEPEALAEGDVVLIGGTALRFERLGVAEEQEVPTVDAKDVDAKDVDANSVDAKEETGGAEPRPDTVPAEPAPAHGPGVRCPG